MEQETDQRRPSGEGWYISFGMRLFWDMSWLVWNSVLGLMCLEWTYTGDQRRENCRCLRQRSNSHGGCLTQVWSIYQLFKFINYSNVPSDSEQFRGTRQSWTQEGGICVFGLGAVVPQPARKQPSCLCLARARWTEKLSRVRKLVGCSILGLFTRKKVMCTVAGGWIVRRVWEDT